MNGVQGLVMTLFRFILYGYRQKILTSIWNISSIDMVNDFFLMPISNELGIHSLE